MLLRNVKLCLRHSEIINYADSEITAETAVVKKYGSPRACGILSLLQKAAISPARMSRFRPAQAGFHSARMGRISLLILNSEIALTGSEILACGSSEIIRSADSEITAIRR